MQYCFVNQRYCGNSSGIGGCGSTNSSAAMGISNSNGSLIKNMINKLYNEHLTRVNNSGYIPPDMGGGANNTSRTNASNSATTLTTANTSKHNGDMGIGMIGKHHDIDNPKFNLHACYVLQLVCSGKLP